MLYDPKWKPETETAPFKSAQDLGIRPEHREALIATLALFETGKVRKRRVTFSDYIPRGEVKKLNSLAISTWRYGARIMSAALWPALVGLRS